MEVGVLAGYIACILNNFLTSDHNILSIENNRSKFIFGACLLEHHLLHVIVTGEREDEYQGTNSNANDSSVEV